MLNGLPKDSRTNPEILGPDVHRLATLHINARSDHELLADWWLKSHADGSPNTVRAYALALKAPLARRCARGFQPRGGCDSGSPSAQRG